jgi:hypothetical protein
MHTGCMREVEISVLILYLLYRMPGQVGQAYDDRVWSFYMFNTGGVHGYWQGFISQKFDGSWKGLSYSRKTWASIYLSIYLSTIYLSISCFYVMRGQVSIDIWDVNPGDHFCFHCLHPLPVMTFWSNKSEAYDADIVFNDTTMQNQCKLPHDGHFDPPVLVFSLS